MNPVLMPDSPDMLHLRALARPVREAAAAMGATRAPAAEPGDPAGQAGAAESQALVYVLLAFANDHGTDPTTFLRGIAGGVGCLLSSLEHQQIATSTQLWEFFAAQTRVSYEENKAFLTPKGRA